MPVVVQDLGPSLQKFLEPDRKPEVIYTDNSQEFAKAFWRSNLESLYVNTTQFRNKWDCWESSAQNQRRGHLQYCCDQVWTKNGGWISMECYCYLRNIHDLLSDGKDSIRKDDSENLFKGPIIPFGSPVEYYLIFCEKTSQESIIWQEKSYLDCFLGYVLYDGWIWERETSWSQTLRKLEKMDASENPCWIDSMQKEVLTPKNGDFYFSRSQLEQRNYLEEIRFWETSTVIPDRPRLTRRKNTKNLLGESEGSSPFSRTSPNDGEARKWFYGPISGDFFTIITLNRESKLYVPREASFPIPLKIYWRDQGYKYVNLI